MLVVSQSQAALLRHKFATIVHEIGLAAEHLRTQKSAGVFGSVNSAQNQLDEKLRAGRELAFDEIVKQSSAYREMAAKAPISFATKRTLSDQALVEVIKLLRGRELASETDAEAVTFRLGAEVKETASDAPLTPGLGVVAALRIGIIPDSVL